jgi:hypothetical protein
VITKIPIHKDSCFRICLKYLTLKLFISFFNRACTQFTFYPDSGLPTPEKPLPLYDNFTIQLKGEELEQLKVLWKEYGARDYAIPKDLVNERWQLKGLLESEGDGYAPFLRTYQFTNLGKIPVGALPLALFNKVQELLLLSELASLEGSVEIALSAGLSCLEERRGDLLIYRAQLRRILVNALYFLEVKADGHGFYKIGVTTRSIEERIAEVQRDVRAHYSDVVVNLLGLWESRGNVELYFKHRYKAFNYRIGKLTEYFAFPDVKAVLQDLYGMKPKMLSDVELDVFSLYDRPQKTSCKKASIKKNRSKQG